MDKWSNTDRNIKLTKLLAHKMTKTFLAGCCLCMVTRWYWTEESLFKFAVVVVWRVEVLSPRLLRRTMYSSSYKMSLLWATKQQGFNVRLFHGQQTPQGQRKLYATTYEGWYIMFSRRASNNVFISHLKQRPPVAGICLGNATC